MNPAPYSRLTLRLIAAWFVLILIVSARHGLDTPAGVLPWRLGLAVLAPLAAFGLWFAAAPGFRAFCMGLDRSVLTMTHAWRLVGFDFLVLYAHGLLPGLFALPAAWGDMMIGATAPFVARHWSGPGHRGRYLVWQALGLVDLVVAVGLGSTAGRLDPGAVSTAVMTALPMSMIPTFAVPLFLIFHFICIAQALRPAGHPRLLFARTALPMA